MTEHDPVPLSEAIAEVRAQLFTARMEARMEEHPHPTGERTDHSEVIMSLRLAADLLEAHDETGISLDKWGPARKFVEYYIGHPIDENGV